MNHTEPTTWIPKNNPQHIKRRTKTKVKDLSQGPNMRVEISMNTPPPTRGGASTSVQLREPVVNLNTEYVSLYSEVNTSVAKFWVIKRGLTSATGMGIAAWIVVAFGGVVTLLVNPGYNACINTAACMITVGVVFSAISAILYTKVIGYCRQQELSVAHLARKLAMGDGGAPAMVTLNHLERPMEVMAPLDVIERAKIRQGPNQRGLPILQYTRGMTLKYGCTGRDGKTTIVYLPDPNAPIDKYPYLKASVIASISFFYTGISVIATFLITWVSAYPNDHQTLTVCVAMEAMGGLLSLIGLVIGAYIYTLCMKYEIEDSSDYEKNAYTNPILTIS